MLTYAQCYEELAEECDRLDLSSEDLGILAVIWAVNEGLGHVRSVTFSEWLLGLSYEEVQPMLRKEVSRD